MAEGGRSAMGSAMHLDSRLRDAPTAIPSVGVDSLPPLLAGARARGMADAFELLGVAAIFLDDDGGALHVSAQAKRLMGDALFLSAGRLTAASATSDAALQAALDAALAGRQAAEEPIVLTCGPLHPSLTLRILGVSGQDESAQLLRAIVLIDCGGAAFRQSLI
jgi:hypothetical protein